MDDNQIKELVGLLRRTSANRNDSVFSISAQILHKLNTLFEENSIGLDLIKCPVDEAKDQMPTNNMHDLKFVLKYIVTTQSLKLYSDGSPMSYLVDISLFKNLKFLELHKINVRNIRGIQQNRPQLKKLDCCQCLSKLKDVLHKSGKDQSLNNCWSELNTASFTMNSLNEIDDSLYVLPWLQTLNLSSNFINNIDIINNLVHLKHLFISDNRLQRLPHFSGPICNTLQTMVAKNNFIDDISGLQTLRALRTLHLSNNCLIEHKCLASISHMNTVENIILFGNPLYYHPQHRKVTATFLHSNINVDIFLLDNVLLEKSHRNIIGLLHPIAGNVGCVKTNGKLAKRTDEKTRRVRKVEIGDIEVETVSAIRLSSEPLMTNQQHLETKKQIENLHEQYGESWLNKMPAIGVQRVLGLDQEESVSSNVEEKVSSTTSLTTENVRKDETLPSPSVDSSETSIIRHHAEAENIISPSDFTLLSEDHSQNDAEYTNSFSSSVSAKDDFDDSELYSDEELFLALPIGNTDQLFLAITKNYLVEKSCSTCQELSRWHIDSVLSYDVLNDMKQVKFIFDTVRKDRKERIYEMDDDERKLFTSCIQEKLAEQKPRNTQVVYQCMRCSHKQFAKKQRRSTTHTSIVCKNCNCDLVVEL